LNYKLILPECNFNNTQFVGQNVYGTWRNLGNVHINFVWCTVVPVSYTVTVSMVNCHHTILWPECIVTGSVWCAVTGKLSTDQKAPLQVLFGVLLLASCLLIRMNHNKFCLEYCCWQGAYWSEGSITGSVWCTVVGKPPTDQNALKQVVFGVLLSASCLLIRMNHNKS